MPAGETTVNILTRLRAGETLLTPNQRAARTLRRAYDQSELQAGLTHWSPANILSAETWLATLWHQLLLSGAETRLLLNRTQQHALWRAIIAADNEALRSPDTLAELAADTWTSASAHNGRQQLREIGISTDTPRLRALVSRLRAALPTPGLPRPRTAPGSPRRPPGSRHSEPPGRRPHPRRLRPPHPRPGPLLRLHRPRRLPHHPPHHRHPRNPPPTHRHGRPNRTPNRRPLVPRPSSRQSQRKNRHRRRPRTPLPARPHLRPPPRTRHPTHHPPRQPRHSTSSPSASPSRS